MSKRTARVRPSLLQELLLAEPVEEAEGREDDDDRDAKTTSTASRVEAGAADWLIFSEVGSR